MQHASSMRSEEGADTQSHLSTQQSHHSTQLDGEGERRKTPVFKTKTVAPKLKAKGDFNKQILLWKQKQEELMPQDTNDGPSSLQLLEVSLLCLCIRFACSLLVLCLFFACSLLAFLLVWLLFRAPLLVDLFCMCPCGKWPSCCALAAFQCFSGGDRCKQDMARATHANLCGRRRGLRTLT